ncbi:MAG: conjugal transfer protein TraB [Desulfobacterales bacterium]|nr:conjugal transfer protein TraB [Desulfobacterales bacterium]MCF8078264.1 conjugal transfer protein TraB [Desulfobacterales bacterium]
MASVDEQILRAAKEIAVKFIEMGRLSPNAFPDFFREIYQTIEETVKGKPPAEEPPADNPPAKE